MGSVAVLTTSGDNDPELEPVQSYRHYLYCDACGSFSLESWESADRPAMDRKRRRLALLGLWATPLLVVPAWDAAGAVFHVSFLVYFAIGMACTLMLFAWLWGTSWPMASWWRFVVRAVPWFGAFLVAEWLCSLLPRWSVATAGAIVIVAALVWRAVLEDRIESLGLRCRECGATFGNHTAFFQDLDANPRGLSVSDVPRPLGSSPFRHGRMVEQ